MVQRRTQAQRTEIYGTGQRHLSEFEALMNMRLEGLRTDKTASPEGWGEANKKLGI
ncbi:MAG: hypothetical protein QS748_03685 [Candidatus Endonucleobacter bathymodioli]|uniref:Uncharacterized protein n=1 Tax=Candidatus Endonucleibacter bathymodioli TaxID=539814 RepID=A0AA90SS75_9GAMM|nr:hypothetical protein [Candidatus Endonucleobacter bathymodioli]